MKHTPLKWFGLTLTALVLLCLGLFMALIGTNWGTRVLAQRIQPVIPDALTFESISGTLLSGIELAGLRWEDHKAVVTVNHIRGKIGLTALLRKTVEIEDSQVQGVEITIHEKVNSTADDPQNGKPTFSFALPIDIILENLVAKDLSFVSPDFQRTADTLALKADLKGSALNVSEFTLEGMSLSFKTSGQLLLAPPYSNDIKLDWRFALDTAQTFAGNGTVSGNLDRFLINHQLTMPYSVRTNGNLSWQDQFGFDIANAWNDLNLSIADHDISSPQGSLTIVGTPRHYDFKLDTTADMAALVLSDLRASGTGNSHELTITNAEVVTNRGRGVMEGKVVLGANGGRWDGQVLFEELDMQDILPTMTGRVNVDMQTKGHTVDWDSVTGTAAINSLSGELLDQTLSGTGNLNISDTGLQIDALDITAGKNHIRVRGIAGDRLDLQIGFSVDQIESLWPQLTGSGLGEITLSGTPQIPIVVGKATGKGLVFRGWAVESVQINGTGQESQQRVKISADNLRHGHTLIDNLLLEASGRLDSHGAAITLQRQANSAKLTLDGGFESEQWIGTIKSFTTSLDQSEQWILQEPAEFEFSTHTQRIASLCLSSGLDKRICGEVHSDLSAKILKGQLRLESFPVKPLIETTMPQLTANGRIWGDLDFSLANEDYSGRLSLRLEQGNLEFYRPQEQAKPADGETLPLEFELNGVMQSNRLDLDGGFGFGTSGAGDMELTVADVRDLESLLGARLTLSVVDLGFLSILAPGLSVEQGSLLGTLTLDGSLSTPEIGGGLKIKDATVSIPEAGTTFSQLQLNMQPEGLDEIGFQGSAVSTKGKLLIEGRAHANTDTGWSTRFTVRGDDVELIRLPDVSLFASPDLTIDLTTRSAIIDGEVLVPRARIALDELPESAVAPSLDTVVHVKDEQVAEQGFGYKVSLSVVAGDDVKLVGYGLSSGLSGKVNLSGTDTTEFRGNGTLNLTKGSFDAYGQSLEIDRGRLTFSGPLDNPSLNLRATRTIDDQVVGIAISGSANKPRSRLYSDPRMSDGSTLSYLITGRPLQEADGEQDKQIAGAALTLGLSNTIAAEIGSGLGLDELTVAGGSGDEQVLAGKRLTDNLYLQYAYGIFDKVGNVLLRYKITDRLTVESESGEEQSLDLIYSVKSD